MDNHSTQWQRVQKAVLNNRVPTSWLFIGPLHCKVYQFAIKTTQLLLCKNKINYNPCSICNDCLMVKRIEHPDMHWIKPDKKGSPIKIDQIRDVQNSVFLTPQRSLCRLIILEGADKMNNAAANALLKILEEPALHTHFILIAEQINTVVPTVLSRCQLIHFISEPETGFDNLLLIGTLYPEDSERASLIKQAETHIEQLIDLIENKQHASVLAFQWSQFDLNNLLWFLYLIYSQTYYTYINDLPRTTLAFSQIMRLKSKLSPVAILEQIDKINVILKKLSHNININHLLVLENLLLCLQKI